VSGSRSFLRLWFSFVLLGLVWLIWPTAVGASSISAPDRVALPPGLADVASRSSHEGGILRAQSPFASAFNGPTAFAYDAASETAPSRILDPERSSAIAVGLQGGAVHLVGSTERIYDSSASFVAPGSILDDASRAAFDAADNVGSFSVKPKHLPGGGGKYNKFDYGVDPNAAIREALTSDAAQFLPNPNLPNTFRVVTDLGRPIGTKGQTSIRVIVGMDGQVINAFPVKVR